MLAFFQLVNCQIHSLQVNTQERCNPALPDFHRGPLGTYRASAP